jgi:hypothetical protein
MTKPATIDSDFEVPRPGTRWAIRHKLVPFVAALSVLVLVQVGINQVMRDSRRAAVAIPLANPTEGRGTDLTSGQHAPDAAAAPTPAVQTSTPLPAIDPNAPLLTWDAATGTWRAQRLGDPQPAPPTAQGVAYTDGYYDMQLGRFVPGGVPPPATGIVTPSPDDQGQRRLDLQQRIAALEAEVQSDQRRANNLGLLGAGFSKAPDILRAQPAGDLSHAALSAFGQLLASGLEDQADRERAEAQARLDVNRRTIQQLRDELATLGR